MESVFKPQAGRVRPPTPVEHPTALILNGVNLVTLQTTPVALDDWAYGFLLTEGIITGAADVQAVQVDPAAAAVSLTARVSPGWDPELANRRYLTSGCGKGITFSSIQDALHLQPLKGDLRFAPPQLVHLMRTLEAESRQYLQTRGIHSAAVYHTDYDQMLVREDIGRHNAVDKAIGGALRHGWNPSRCLVLTTGRISYDMCLKFARYGLAIGASRTAATDQAVRLAQRLNLTLVGYLRRHRQVVYTGAHRLAKSAAG